MESKLRSNRGTTRRTVLKGAAWSTPIIATTFGAPLAAASPGGCVEIERCLNIAPSSTGSFATGYHSSTHKFVVPEGVTEIVYEIAGGGGGFSQGGSLARDVSAGSGDLITGVLSVVPGMVLELVVGNGGIGLGGSGTDNPAATVVRGGAGFGNGGDVTTGDVQCRYSGASGGGGSAILLRSADSPNSTLPLVVAGGGGGTGGVWMNSTSDAQASVLNAPNGGNAGREAASGGDALVSLGFNGSEQLAKGGGGASGTTPGQQANSGESQGEGNQVEGRFLNYGKSGEGFRDGAGGHGGEGRVSAVVESAKSGMTYTVTSGGGGGGYAGGASGDASAFAYPNTYVGLAAGGGGGASSYVVNQTVEGAVVLTSDFAKAGNSATQPSKRMPGWLMLTYYECV